MSSTLETPAARARHTPATRHAITSLSALFGAGIGLVGVGGGWGAAGGLVAGLAGGLWLARQPAGSERADARRFAADLPIAIDLLAAALRAGSPPDAAARLVADAVGGPVGRHLSRVERSLSLGAGPVEAWSHLGGTEGAVRVARAAERSGHSGAAFADALFRVADDLRADAVVTADAAARRAGVLIVLPLGLCFLPAFVLTGLVPVIVAIVGDVLTATP